MSSKICQSEIINLFYYKAPICNYCVLSKSIMHLTDQCIHIFKQADVLKIFVIVALVELICFLSFKFLKWTEQVGAWLNARN